MSLDQECLLPTPLGPLRLRARGGRLVAIAIPRDRLLPPTGLVTRGVCDSGVLYQAAQQLAAYFAGRRREFRLPLDLSPLPPFTRRVLAALCTVPFAATVTYGELAARVGSPGAARAVGQAMAANPLPIVIPCHRVVAAGGRPGGYSGGDGVPTKQWLLAFEQGERR